MVTTLFFTNEEELSLAFENLTVLFYFCMIVILIYNIPPDLILILILDSYALNAKQSYTVLGVRAFGSYINVLISFRF